MSKHTPEPWKLDGEWIVPENFDNEAWVEGEDNAVSPVVGMWVHDRELLLDPTDARRIVACVNACAGLSTEALETIAQEPGNKRLRSLAFEAEAAVEPD